MYGKVCLKEEIKMTHEEICEEIKRLEDWEQYYFERYEKTNREFYLKKLEQSRAKIVEFRTKIGTAPVPKPFLKPALDKAKLQVSQAVKDKFKAMKPIDTGQLKRSIEAIKKPKPFLKPIVDKLVSEIKIGKEKVKAAGITIEQSLKGVAKEAGVDFDLKGLRKRMQDYYDKLPDKEKKDFEMMYGSLRPPDSGQEEK